MTARAALFAPIILPQALWVAARASRLPEASGPRSGILGQGPARSLLILGDSSAAGVGVTDQREALAGNLAALMSERFTLSWQVVAKSGETSAGALRMAEALPDQRFDYVLIALGVNDAKNGVPLSRWSRQYRALLDVCTGRFGASVICMSGLPPLRDFPILPWPLNAVLGDRADLFDRTLQSLAVERANAVHLPTRFSLDVSSMASDGFHPGPTVYAEWAHRANAVFT